MIQPSLIKNLFSGGKATLIILDACRYDYFEEALEEIPIPGKLRKIESAGRNTFEYVARCFPVTNGRWPIIYISGAPPINSIVSDLSNAKVMRSLYESVPRDQFVAVLDVWDWGWDTYFSTSIPGAVSRAAIQRADVEKMVIHYFQPHAPYIGEKKLLGYVNSKPLAHFHDQGNKAPCAKIWEGINSGEITGDQVIGAYRSNLELVMREVKLLVPSLSGKIVITADHGEMLGEDELWGHGDIDHQKIREVPWMEVNNEINRRY